MSVAVINHPSSGVSDADAEAMTEAVNQQVADDFGPAWHTSADVSFVPAGVKPPAGSWHVVLLGNSDQAGALGYHDLTPKGLPLGKVFAGTDLQYGQSVSVTLSHEVLEMLGDPWINLAAQSRDGKFYAWEAGDPVEADELGYQVNGVLVSDFVTPAWFGHGCGAVDRQSRVTRPFELAPGGYVSVFDPASGQGWTQVQGPRLGSRSASRALAFPRVGSRRERRFRGRDAWLVSSYDVAG